MRAKIEVFVFKKLKLARLLEYKIHFVLLKQDQSDGEDLVGVLIAHEISQSMQETDQDVDYETGLSVPGHR